MRKHPLPAACWRQLLPRAVPAWRSSCWSPSRRRRLPASMLLGPMTCRCTWRRSAVTLNYFSCCWKPRLRQPPRPCQHVDAGGGESSAWSLPHSAASGGSTAAIEALLQLHPEAVDWASNYGHLALHAAYGGGHLAAVQLLLKAAPHTGVVADSQGGTPLHWATSHAAAVELLLQASPATASAANSGGHVPLRSAAASGDAASVQLLLQAAPAMAAAADLTGRLPPALR